MPSLPQSVLLSKLRGALPSGTTAANDEVHPALLTIPQFGVTRVYLWTITHVQSNDRPIDEFKIQLILPGQNRRTLRALEMANRIPTFLLGYSPDFGVFTGWEASLHASFAFSAAVQVKEETLDEARGTGWAVATPRRVRGGEEVRVAFTAGNLLHYLKIFRKADSAALSGADREAFFLANTPNVSRVNRPPEDLEVEDRVIRARQRLATLRLERDRRFGPKVRQQYLYSCAVCRTELEIIEGAHIIPANESTGEDAIWNGVALCPNHHKLFDATAFLIGPDLRIKVDYSTVGYFQESGRSAGLQDLLLRYDTEPILEPLFFGRDIHLRNKMTSALQLRAALSGIEG